MSQELCTSILSQQTADYTTTAAWVNVPQHVITAPEDGDYNIVDISNLYADASADTTAIRLAVNGNSIKRGGSSYVTGGVLIQTTTLVAMDIPLKVGDIVSLQALFLGTSTVVRYTGYGEGLQITKVGV